MFNRILLVAALAMPVAATATIPAPEATITTGGVKISMGSSVTGNNAVGHDRQSPNHKIAVRKPGARVEQELNALYWPPLYRQFYGVSSELAVAGFSREFYPVGYPIVWDNESSNPSSVSYAWDVNIAPDSNDWVAVQESQRELSVTYYPQRAGFNFSSPWSIYPLPTLTATDQGGNTASYNGQASALQAGGCPIQKSYIPGDGYFDINYGVLPFDPYADELGIFTMEPLEAGQPPVPIFGYSPQSDDWWRNYTYIDPTPEKFSYTTSYINYVMLHEDAPMVVYGANAGAYGKIGQGAQFTLTVRALEEDGTVIDDFVAQTTCSGADLYRREAYEGYEFVNINFVFDEPLVLDPAESPAGYIFEVSGFRGPDVEYFAPLQSLIPNDMERCYGFYRNHRNFGGVIDDSFDYVAFFSNQYGEMYCAFDISLDAAYPWLMKDPGYEGPALVTVNEEALTLPLLSYYDAADLEVKAPAWLDAEVTGRYNQTMLTMKVNTPSTIDRSGSVTLSAPGVKLTIRVQAPASVGIEAVDASSVAPDKLYNMQGILLKSGVTADELRNMPAGLYILNGEKISIN